MYKIIDNIDDLTVDLYCRILEKKDISLLKNGAKGDVLKAWSKIEDEILEIHLSDKDFLKALEDEVDEALAMYEYLVEQSPIAEANYKAILDKKAAEMEKKKADIDDMIILIEDYRKIPFDKKNKSVRDFYKLYFNIKNRS